MIILPSASSSNQRASDPAIGNACRFKPASANRKNSKEAQRVEAATEFSAADYADDADENVVKKNKK